MRSGLVPHMLILSVSAALSLLLLQGAVVGRAPTIFQIDWVHARISIFLHSSFSPASRKVQDTTGSSPTLEKKWVPRA